jgi:hypothetical protein
MGWRNFYKTAEKKSSSPCAAGVFLYLFVCSSVRLFICLSVRLSIIYENTLNFHVGIKIRVSTWSFLSVLHLLQIPIPMYEKKVRVQQENLYKITYYLYVLPTKFLHYYVWYHKPAER